MAERQSTQFLLEFRHTVQDVVRQLSTECLSADTLNAVSRRLDALDRNLTSAGGNLCTPDQAVQLQRQVDILQEECRTLVPSSSSRTGFEYRAAEVRSGKRGRPSLLLTETQLRFLVSCGFTNPEIAAMLDMSVSSVKNRLKKHQIRRPSGSIGDSDLDQKIREVIRGNSSIGPNAVKARLKANGVHVSRQRVREAMHRIDPVGCAQRSMVATNRLSRRRYNVAAPQSMWHIDGNHKLIRWGIVIHGGIDGYSRMMVFLRASDNNRAQTAFNLFQAAVQEYGVPSRVRTDKGGENNMICWFMEEERGAERGSAIRGRSVHNQRIERAWVDVWNGCTNVFHDLFNYLESVGALDPDNEVHKWALHFIFLPRINRVLADFTGQWNNHGLSTEKYATPIQLFVKGALANFSGNLTAIRDLFYSATGTADGTVQVPNVSDDGRVVVPRVACPLTSERLAELRESINPLDDSGDDQGIELYHRTLDFIQSEND